MQQHLSISRRFSKREKQYAHRIFEYFLNTIGGLVKLKYRTQIKAELSIYLVQYKSKVEYNVTFNFVTLVFRHLIPYNVETGLFSKLYARINRSLTARGSNTIDIHCLFI